MSYYYSSFPESMFPAISNVDDYIERIHVGEQRLKNASIAICLLARDLGNTVINTIARIKKLASFAHYCRIFIYENDSSDNTLDILKQWVNSDSRVTLLSEHLGNKKHEQIISIDRTVDMAYYRNQYLSLLRDSKYTPDYVFVLDSDILGGFSYEGILNSIGHMTQSKIDVMGSNGIIYQNKQRLYFDYWAHRNFGNEELLEAEEINLRRYERGEFPKEVFSCFGGLAIYKSHCLLNNSIYYRGGDCDHPTLNKQLRNLGYTIFLNPSQIVLYSKTRYTFGG